MNWQVVRLFWLCILATAIFIAILATWATWIDNDKSKNRWRAVVSVIVVLAIISIGLGLEV